MLRAVTIIGLMFSFTLAEAAPRRYQPPRRRPLCERILVSEPMQDRVSEVAVEIATLIGEMKLKTQVQETPGNQLRFAASDEQVKEFGQILGQLNYQVQQIRDSYRGQTDAQIEPAVAALEALVKSELPKIKDGIALVTPPPPSAQPRRFMKRELFGQGGPLDGMEDWSASEIESYLHDAQKDQPPKTQQPPPPPPPLHDWPQVGGFRPNWPPMEKP